MMDLQITAGRTTFLDLVIQGRKMDAGIRGVIRDLTKQYEARLKAELRRPKGGKLYGAQAGRRTYGRAMISTVIFGQVAKYRGVARGKINTATYRASAPGEAPAVHTGTEINAIRVKMSGYKSRIFAQRGVVRYRHLLEFGTKDRVGHGKKGGARYAGRVAPRPVFSPLQAQIEGELSQAIGRAADAFAAFGG